MNFMTAFRTVVDGETIHWHPRENWPCAEIFPNALQVESTGIGTNTKTPNESITEGMAEKPEAN